MSVAATVITLLVAAGFRGIVRITGNKRLLRISVTGSAVAAVCCFTPVLVISLAAVGLSAAAVWLDYVLLPSPGLFLALTACALIRRQRNP